MKNIAISESRIEDHWFDQYTWSNIHYSTSLTAGAYLQFARADLLGGISERNLINAASNAKRALHLEVETISKALGADYSKKKIGNFPQRLEFLVKCGILGPSILEKTNALRNSIEHEYYVPKVEEVKDFIDITSLFIEATKFYRLRYPCEVDLFDAWDDTLVHRIASIRTSLQQGELTFEIWPHDKRADRFYREVSVNDQEYFVWLPFILRNNS